MASDCTASMPMDRGIPSFDVDGHGLQHRRQPRHQLQWRWRGLTDLAWSDALPLQADGKIGGGRSEATAATTTSRWRATTPTARPTYFDSDGEGNDSVPTAADEFAEGVTAAGRRQDRGRRHEPDQREHRRLRRGALQRRRQPGHQLQRRRHGHHRRRGQHD